MIEMSLIRSPVPSVIAASRRPFFPVPANPVFYHAGREGPRDQGVEGEAAIPSVPWSRSSRFSSPPLLTQGTSLDRNAHTGHHAGGASLTAHGRLAGTSPGGADPEGSLQMAKRALTPRRFWRS